MTLMQIWKIIRKTWRNWSDSLRGGETLMDGEYKFNALTPIDDAEIGVYESALNFVFLHENVRNVAISGAYGSGKSSILASYKKKHSNKKFLHISLAHFHPATKDSTIADDEKSTETILEGKILNQLIHQISPSKITLTNFRVKKEKLKRRNIISAILVAISCVLGLYSVFFTQWTLFVQSLSVSWLKNALAFTEQPEIRLVIGLSFAYMIGVFIYRFLKLQGSRHKIKRADVSGVGFEVFEDSNESYFDKYLNEVLYLFENADADVIVFEDIDRYDLVGIFERLHEINTLVNSNRKGSLLRFFYLMRDDIFESRDRMKFFDFIIPIVPVIDSSNSYDRFIDRFEQSGLIGSETSVIDLDFLQGLSLYIDEMRILQNICNEFFVYYSRLSITEPDPNKMLALIAVKNLFPRDFANLQLGRGYLFEIIGGNGKERLIKTEKAAIQNIITTKSNELEAVRNELLFSDEIAVLYHSKLYMTQRSGYQRFNLSDNPQTCRQNIENNRDYLLRPHSAIFDEYDARMARSAENDNAKALRVAALEADISTLKSELTELTGRRLHDIINRSNIENLFQAQFQSVTGNKVEEFNEIKDSPYFPLLKYLVREGFVDETYSDYMTYFYENSITRTDEIFLRSIRDKRAKETSYSLDNPQMVASRIPLAYFEQEEILNYALFDYLLTDFTSERIFVDKTKRLLIQVLNKRCFDFILGYSEQKDALTSLVIALGTEWNSFISDLFDTKNIKGTPANPKGKNDVFLSKYAYTLLTLIGEKTTRTSFLDEASKKHLAEYLSKDSGFLAIDECDDSKVALGIKHLEIRFVGIDTETARRSLLELIYKDKSYVINYDNIAIMLSIFYKESNFNALRTENYSAIMDDRNSPLSEYIHANIDDYMSVYLAICGGVITDTPDNVISLLNNESIDFNLNP